LHIERTNTRVDRSACTTGPRCTRGQSTQSPCIFSGFLKTIKIKILKYCLEKNSTLNSVSENVKVFPAPTLTKDPRQTITHIPQISSICRKRWTVLFIHKTTPFLPEVNLWQQAMQGGGTRVPHMRTRHGSSSKAHRVIHHAFPFLSLNLCFLEGFEADFPDGGEPPVAVAPCLWFVQSPRTR